MATTVRDAAGRRVQVVSHGKYDVRDQQGHYVAPITAEDRPCPHHCCANRRIHPRNLPVRLNRAYLRSLSESDLERELEQYARYQDTHEAGFLQIIAEDRRRRESAERAGARRERARDRRERANEEHRDEVYRQWLRAEAATKGNMLNAAGRRAGINERSLFTGPESRVVKYASPELFEFFEQHGRPTRAAFLGSSAERRRYYAGRRIGLPAARADERGPVDELADADERGHQDHAPGRRSVRNFGAVFGSRFPNTGGQCRATALAVPAHPGRARRGPNRPPIAGCALALPPCASTCPALSPGRRPSPGSARWRVSESAPA